MEHRDGEFDATRSAVRCVAAENGELVEKPEWASAVERLKPSAIRPSVPPGENIRA